MYNADNNRLITTRATTGAGKFMLLAEPGKYGLTVTKEAYKTYVVSKLNVQGTTKALAVQVEMERGVND
jgi:predicted ATPase